MPQLAKMIQHTLKKANTNFIWLQKKFFQKENSENSKTLATGIKNFSGNFFLKRLPNADAVADCFLSSVCETLEALLKELCMRKWYL